MRGKENSCSPMGAAGPRAPERATDGERTPRVPPGGSPLGRRWREITVRTKRGRRAGESTRKKNSLTPRQGVRLAVSTGKVSVTRAFAHIDHNRKRPLGFMAGGLFRGITSIRSSEATRRLFPEHQEATTEVPQSFLESNLKTATPSRENLWWLKMDCSPFSPLPVVLYRFVPQAPFESIRSRV